MQTVITLLGLWLVAVAAVPTKPNRIVGGFLTTIENYPSAVSLLYSWDWIEYAQNCAGTIINSRSILTAAHCADNEAPGKWHARVGSTYANSGGVVHRVRQCIVSPQYDGHTLDNDIAIMRLASLITYGTTTQPAPIPGPEYPLEGNEIVFAAGWGGVAYGGAASEQLRHVQVWTISWEDCNARYGLVGMSISENMLCSGVLDVGGRDQCTGDSGGPLYHQGVLVGVCSWGKYCADPRYPGVNVLVPRHSVWIQNNA